MTTEEKNLLLKDLCARLPHGVKATTTSNGWRDVYIVSGHTGNRILLDCPVYDEGDDEWLVEFVKPYLRPMSSMTEEERNEYLVVCTQMLNNSEFYAYQKTPHLPVDWLNEHHLDYRGLIEMGLALPAKEGMYKI